MPIFASIACSRNQKIEKDIISELFFISFNSSTKDVFFSDTVISHLFSKQLNSLSNSSNSLIDTLHKSNFSNLTKQEKVFALITFIGFQPKSNSLRLSRP